MIVITLSKVPLSLRGDLTKWYQEIQTGVYVGNVNAKVREQVWARIERDIGSGQAVMVYNAKNELGYQFRTTRKDHEIVDFDGIPLLKRLKRNPVPPKLGFSDAAKFHRARMYSRSGAKRSVPKSKTTKLQNVVAIDIETTGLDVKKDEIISIGGVRRDKFAAFESLNVFIQSKKPIPQNISDLTGITTDLLNSQGVPLGEGLSKLVDFVRDFEIVGYNVHFDDQFISAALKKEGKAELANSLIDLMPIVKKKNRFIDNFKLATVLKEYGISNEKPHHAESDAMATFLLAEKVMKN